MKLPPNNSTEDYKEWLSCKCDFISLVPIFPKFEAI